MTNNEDSTDKSPDSILSENLTFSKKQIEYLRSEFDRQRRWIESLTIRESAALQELEENNITVSEFDGTVLRNKHWEAYTYHYAKRARTYLTEAKKLIPLLPRRSRYSPAAMTAFYDAILKQIIKRQGDVFSSRVRLNKVQKIWLAAAVYVRYRFLPFFLTPVWDIFAKVGLLPRV